MTHANGKSNADVLEEILVNKPPVDYKIRLALRHEIPEIQKVDLAASRLFVPTGLIDEGPEGPEPVPADILLAGIKNDLLFVSINQYNVPVGFVLSRIQMPDLYLEQISVDPEHGNRGIGASLLKHTITEADRLKLRGVTLSTFRTLAWNGPFYSKHGFKEIPRRFMQPWMFALERIQSQTMDVRLRCFMRRPGAWKHRWIRLKPRTIDKLSPD